MIIVQQVYTFPDGTKTTARPTDGQVFNLWGTNPMSNSGGWNDPQSIWQWDDVNGQWYDITPTNNTIRLPDGLEINITVSEDMSTKCECGSEKVGSSRHSNYCPKYET